MFSGEQMVWRWKGTSFCVLNLYVCLSQTDTCKPCVFIEYSMSLPSRHICLDFRRHLKLVLARTEILSSYLLLHAISPLPCFLFHDHTNKSSRLRSCAHGKQDSILSSLAFSPRCSPAAVPGSAQTPPRRWNQGQL